MVISLLRIFLVSILLFFSNLAFGKYITFLDPKSELIISKYLGKKYLIGSANYSFLFWNIYDAELYSTSNKFDSKEIAIVLKYNRPIDKNTLVKETIDDIKQQENISKQREEKWKILLDAIYVSTKIDKKFIRHFEISENYADISKIKKKLKWHPHIKYKQIINKLFEYGK